MYQKSNVELIVLRRSMYFKCSMLINKSINSRQRRVRRGLRLSDQVHGEDVRVQEAREEEDQEEARRDHGDHRETNFAENQFTIRRQPCLCI